MCPSCVVPVLDGFRRGATTQVLRVDSTDDNDVECEIPSEFVESQEPVYQLLAAHYTRQLTAGQETGPLENAQFLALRRAVEVSVLKLDRDAAAVSDALQDAKSLVPAHDTVPG